MTEEGINQDELQYQIPVEKPKKRINTTLLIIIAFVVVFVISLIFMQVKSQKVTPTSVNITNTTILSNENILEGISIKQFVDTIDSTYDKNVSLKGYLRKELIPVTSKRNETTAYYNKYYVVDDFGNRLSLTFTSKLNYEQYFITNETSTEVYLLSGELKWTYDGMVLNVEKTEKE